MKVAEHEDDQSRLMNIPIELYFFFFLAQPKTLPVVKGLLPWGNISADCNGRLTKSQDC